tara:strand:+ start:69 stop:170 length:102 start_codon:yes stop_codon:yes gene_type:complete
VVELVEELKEVLAVEQVDLNIIVNGLLLLQIML